MSEVPLHLTPFFTQSKDCHFLDRRKGQLPEYKIFLRWICFAYCCLTHFCLFITLLKTWANCGWQGLTSSLSHPGPGFYPANLGTSPIFCGFGQWVQSAGDNVGDYGGDNAGDCGWQSLTILDNPPLMAGGTAPPHLLNSMCRVKFSLQKAKPHFHDHSFLPDLIPIPLCCMQYALFFDMLFCTFHPHKPPMYERQQLACLTEEDVDLSKMCLVFYIFPGRQVWIVL